MRIQLTQDLVQPFPGREGCGILVGRAGRLIDERIATRLAVPEAASTTVPDERPAPSSDVDPEPAGAGYEQMKPGELRDMAEARGLDAKGLRKQELVEMLEYDDERRGS